MLANVAMEEFGAVAFSYEKSLKNAGCIFMFLNGSMLSKYNLENKITSAVCYFLTTELRLYNRVY